MKETKIEKSIKLYIQNQGGWCQRMNSGRIVTQRGKYRCVIHLADKGCPDLIALMNKTFYGIEIKKNEKEKEKWLKLRSRYLSGEKLPKSYDREEAQFEQCDNILNAGGQFIIASSIDDVSDVFDKL